MKAKMQSFRLFLRSAIPFLCNVFGTLILLAVIGIAVPLSLPRMFGYEIYNVLSPSMSPAIPMGSVVYAEEVIPEDVTPDDIIVYASMNDTVTHRVVENRIVEGLIITKGDVNESVDAPVPYDAVVGKVVLHLPFYGSMSDIYASTIGKIYLIGFAVIGVLMNFLASRLRDRFHPEEETAKE